jgi:hypothetical protein
VTSLPLGAHIRDDEQVMPFGDRGIDFTNLCFQEIYNPQSLDEFTQTTEKQMIYFICKLWTKTGLSDGSFSKQKYQFG